MVKKQRKRDRVKKAIKSGGQKIATFAKSRIVRVPLLGLIAFVIPGKALALTIDLPEEIINGASGLGQFGSNGTFVAAEYWGTRQVVGTGIKAIPDPATRSAVATVGSIAALVGGVSCGVGSAVCSGMGWQQKAVVCLHGVGICSGVAAGMSDADPINPLTKPGKLAGDVASGVLEKMSA